MPEKLTSVSVALSGELLELQRQRGPGIRDGPGRESRPQALWEVARRPLLRRPALRQMRLEARLEKRLHHRNSFWENYLNMNNMFLK